MLKFNLDLLDGVDLDPSSTNHRNGELAIRYSTAVSLKRIADALSSRAIADALETHLPVLAMSIVRNDAPSPGDFVKNNYDEVGTVTPPIDVAISKYVYDRLGTLSLNDFDMMPDREQNELIQAAIKAVREWDKANAFGSGDVFSNVGKVTAAVAEWLAPDAPEILRFRNDQLIDVRYHYATRQHAAGTPMPPEVLYLGEAIEWSTWNSGARRLKASIAQWRPL